MNGWGCADTYQKEQRLLAADLFMAFIVEWKLSAPKQLVKRMLFPSSL